MQFLAIISIVSQVLAFVKYIPDTVSIFKNIGLLLTNIHALMKWHIATSKHIVAVQQQAKDPIRLLIDTAPAPPVLIAPPVTKSGPYHGDVKAFEADVKVEEKLASEAPPLPKPSGIVHTTGDAGTNGGLPTGSGPYKGNIEGYNSDLEVEKRLAEENKP